MAHHRDGGPGRADSEWPPYQIACWADQHRDQLIRWQAHQQGWAERDRTRYQTCLMAVVLLVRDSRMRQKCQKCATILGSRWMIQRRLLEFASVQPDTRRPFE